MDVNQMFPSKYVKGAELKGATPVTIEHIKTEQIYRPGEGKVNCFVLYCKNASRGVVLNRVLALQIAEAIGEPDTDKWTGHQVVLYPQPMTVAGKDVIAIRARAVNGSKL